MSKEAYYFSHDSNARNDAKIVRLRRKLGLEGYGIYFCIVEMLREDSSFKLQTSSFEDISFSINVTIEKVRSVVTEFDLFVIDDDYFYSPRLTRSMQKYNELKTKRVEAGKKGGQAMLKQTLSKTQANEEQSLSNAQANVEQDDKQCLSDTQALKERKGKEIKGNERKEKKIVVPPSIDEVISFFASEGYSESSARKAWNHYNDGDWFDSNGKKVIIWKSKMRNVWFRDEHKQQPKDDIEQYRHLKYFKEFLHGVEGYTWKVVGDEIIYTPPK